MITLSEPSWTGVRPVNPFFINIYELPHIKDRITNVPHFLTLKFNYLFFLGNINFTCLILFLSTISTTNLYESWLITCPTFGIFFIFSIRNPPNVSISKAISSNV